LSSSSTDKASADTGAGLYGCKASVDLFGLSKDDLIDQVKDVITVEEFTTWPLAVRSSLPDGRRGSWPVPPGECKVDPSSRGYHLRIPLWVYFIA
jgi:hypothetical protein